MRVLVTGSTGFIGGVLVRRLVEAGHDVVGLARRAGGVAESPLQIQADIGHEDLVDQIMGTVPACEAVVHAAACRDTRPGSVEVSRTNCLGTHYVLALAARWSCRRFVYISGVAVIGVPKVLPITEDHPAWPRIPYHASKLYGEHLVEAAAANGLSTITLRVTAPIGPGMPPDRMLSLFARRALANAPLQLHGTGGRRQNYVDVRDVARVVEECLGNAASGVFNIGGFGAISNANLAALCVRVLGSKSTVGFTGEPDPEDAVAWDVSSDKARQTLGYRPVYALENSIRDVARELSATQHP